MHEINSPDFEKMHPRFKQLVTIYGTPEAEKQEVHTLAEEMICRSYFCLLISSYHFNLCSIIKFSCKESSVFYDCKKPKNSLSKIVQN